MSLEIFSDKKPSELIKGIILDYGSVSVDCEHCGRTHFNSEGRHMEEGELEELEQKQEAEPGRYISHMGDVRWGVIEGKQVVINCPCHKLREIEENWWADKRRIIEYLTERARLNLENAQEDFDRVKRT